MQELLLENTSFKVDHPSPASLVVYTAVTYESTNKQAHSSDNSSGFDFECSCTAHLTLFFICLFTLRVCVFVCVAHPHP